MKLTFEKYSFIIAIINLLVLYIILRKILFKKVTNFMDERAQKIKDSIAHSENLKIESEKIKLEYESHLNQALKESIEIISEAKNRASKEYDSIILAARDEAEKIILNSHKEAERARQQMIGEVKNYVTELTISAASKLMSANMDSAKNKQLVAKFIDEDGGI